jgi:hypothetical protein
MTVQNSDADKGGLANAAPAAIKGASVRKLLEIMKSKTGQSSQKIEVRHRSGPAPSRTVKLSNGIVLSMIRRDIYDRVIRGRAA